MNRIVGGENEDVSFLKFVNKVGQKAHIRRISVPVHLIDPLSLAQHPEDFSCPAYEFAWCEIWHWVETVDRIPVEVFHARKMKYARLLHLSQCSPLTIHMLCAIAGTTHQGKANLLVC